MMGLRVRRMHDMMCVGWTQSSRPTVKTIERWLRLNGVRVSVARELTRFSTRTLHRSVDDHPGWRLYRCTIAMQACCRSEYGLEQ